MKKKPSSYFYTHISFFRNDICLKWEKGLILKKKLEAVMQEQKLSAVSISITSQDQIFVS